MDHIVICIAILCGMALGLLSIAVIVCLTSIYIEDNRQNSLNSYKIP